MTRYVALLRGINVGGKNLIRMTDLRACFEAEGFADVVTYIQSGNVLFSAAGAAGALARRIEGALGAAFAYQAVVVLRSQAKLTATVTGAPDGFGADAARHRYDVLFLREPLTAAAAMKHVPTRAGVDRVWPGPGVIYHSRLIARATQSQLGRIVGLPIYQQLTIRNWNTTTKLLALMEPRPLGRRPSP
jgi:uncharacterized protein (DUF1697 family)